MGVGVERSRDRALRFLTLAAKAKYPLSCTALAITLEEVRCPSFSASSVCMYVAYARNFGQCKNLACR